MRATPEMTYIAAALTTVAGGVAARMNFHKNPVVAGLAAISGILPWCFIGSMFYHIGLPQALGVIGLYLSAPVFLLAIAVLAVSGSAATSKTPMLILIAGLCMGLFFTFSMFDLLCQMP